MFVYRVRVISQAIQKARKLVHIQFARARIWRIPKYTLKLSPPPELPSSVEKIREQ